jgi:hypothetical protein
MRSRRFVRVLKFALFAVLFVAAFGLVVMSLWNWLMPALFGWKLIGFWQALGLVILSKILFGGFRGPAGRGMYWRRRMMGRMMERWERMTPEEREKFRQGVRGRWGPFEPPNPKPTA